MTKRDVCFVLLFCAMCAAPSYPEGLFANDSILEVTLTGPLGKVLEAGGDGDALPFVLSSGGTDQTVHVRARGKSRLRVCEFPPLRLSFNDHPAEQSVFAGQSRIKLVSHCRKAEAGQADALQEYLAYRIFNLLSDVGYRVRLLHVTYVDSDAGGANAPLSRYAFVLESRGALARRLGGEKVDLTGITLGSLDAAHLARVSIFQYMIGNTDWSLVMADADDTCCHNGDLLDIGSRRYYIPYDFDLSGLVNARYARPDSTLRIKRVTQRLYRGPCTSREILASALDSTLERRDEIMALVSSLPALSTKERRATERFLGKFFEQAQDRDKLLQRFERRCMNL